MEMRLQIVLERDGKNIDSTDNVKKPLSQKKSGRGRHSFLLYEGGQKILFFYLRGVKNFDLALRGGFKIFVSSFLILPPPYCWVINDQPLRLNRTLLYIFRHLYSIVKSIL